jgi:hypothetical protein
MSEDYAQQTTPQVSDTKRQLLARILRRLGTLTGDTNRPPLVSDSEYVLLTKILKTLNHK